MHVQPEGIHFKTLQTANGQMIPYGHKLVGAGNSLYLCHSLEKTQMLGKIEGRRRRGWQRMRWLDGITNSMDIVWVNSGSSVMDREAWHAAVHRLVKSWTQLSDWTTSLCLHLVNKFMIKWLWGCVLFRYWWDLKAVLCQTLVSSSSELLTLVFRSILYQVMTTFL